MDIEELKKENEHLTQLNAVKSEIVSIGAHQIRTSLAALKWIIKMFLDGDLGKLTSEQETLLRKAYEGNERSISLVSEILLINKSEDVVEKKYVFDSIDLVDMIENIIFDFSGESIARGIEIIFLKPDTTIPHVSADKEKIRVVFQNLIENAIKYSHYHGKIFISIKVNDAGLVEVSVKDSGIGISEDSKKKIFEKFYRTDGAQKKEAMGSGIGLYTTKKIAEAQGGKVWFESQEGQGTTFFFTTPVWKN